MNYEKIIIELLSRIQALEEKVGITGKETTEDVEDAINALLSPRKKYKVSTNELKIRIKELLESEKQAGKEYTELICGILHKKWELRNAVPMVCNAMKACMGVNDSVVFSSPSGYSSTLKIRYNFPKPEAVPDKITADKKDIKKAEEKELKPEIKPVQQIAVQQVAVQPAAAQQAAVRPAVKPAAPLPPRPLDIEEVWNRILRHEWVIFYLPDGGEFAYVAGNDYLSIVRTNFRLPRADIEKALALYPFKNSVPLQHLRYPSYIFAILTDERITGDPIQ